MNALAANRMETRRPLPTCARTARTPAIRGVPVLYRRQVVAALEPSIPPTPEVRQVNLRRGPGDRARDYEKLAAETRRSRSVRSALQRNAKPKHSNLIHRVISE